MPLPDYAWRLSHLVIVLLIGIIMNAAGMIGAGDAKFAAAAAPFIAGGDIRLILPLFAANLLAAFVTHRLARHSPLASTGARLGKLEPRLGFPDGSCAWWHFGHLHRIRSLFRIIITAKAVRAVQTGAIATVAPRTFLGSVPNLAPNSINSALCGANMPNERILFGRGAHSR